MERREAMPMSGAASYYMHRGFTPPSSGWQLEVYGPSPSVRSLSSPNPNLPLQSPNIGGGGSAASAFQGESPSPVSQHGGGGVNVSGHGGSGGGSTQGETVKKRRGRPRKYGPDGTVALGLSPISSTNAGPGSSEVGAASFAGSGSGMPTQKRGRGRSLGSGKKQQFASHGEWVSSSAGTGFTPHIMSISAGEDIASKIMAFSHVGPRAICIMSGTGAVSTATLRQPATSGGTVTYEGRFEILSLSGFYFLTDDDASCSRSGLSVSLSSPDGRVVGGGVAGQLIAASPVQVIVGSFVYGSGKAKNKPKPDSEPGSVPDLPLCEKQLGPSSQPNHNVNPIFPGWQGSRELDMKNSHLDLDLTRG